ncbi:regulator, partial [Rhizobium leguminosarum bv. viciae]
MIMKLFSSSSRSRERFLEAILQSAIEYAIISTDLDG